MGCHPKGVGMRGGVMGILAFGYRVVLSFEGGGGFYRWWVSPPTDSTT